MNPRRKSLLLVGLALALAGLAAGCHGSPPDPDNPPVVNGGEVVLPVGSPQLAALAVETAEVCDSPPLRLFGRLTWDDGATVRVFTPFAGRVDRIMVELGQTVKAGTLLAEIASPDFGQAQSNARRAVADLAQAERTAARLRDLVGHGAVAQKDLQAAEADLVRAQSERERTRAQLRLYGGDAETIDQAYRLRAPIDGVVVEKNINPGQEVRPDQMLANVPQLAAPLFTVSDPRRLWVQIDARESELPMLEPGDAFVVHMHAFPEQSFPGRIDVVADAVDCATRMVRVRGSVDNAGRQLKAEMFVTVDLPSREPKAIHVATKAVFLKGEKHFVYVEPMPGRFLRREVRVGREHDGRLAVLAGLESGERVVSSGCLLLEQLLQSNG